MAATNFTRPDIDSVHQALDAIELAQKALSNVRFPRYPNQRSALTTSAGELHRVAGEISTTLGQVLIAEARRERVGAPQAEG